MPNHFDTADAIINHLADRSFAGLIDHDAADYFDNEEWAGFHILANVGMNYNGTITITAPDGTEYEWTMSE
jgi:hypothetical protein